MRWSFQFGRTQIRHITLIGCRHTATGNVIVTGLEIQGELVVPTERFWHAVCRQFGVCPVQAGSADWATLWESIAARRPDATVNYWIARDAFGDGRLISVSPTAADPSRRDRTVPRRLSCPDSLRPRRPSRIHLPLDPLDDADIADYAPGGGLRWHRPSDDDHDGWPLFN